jgi:hypothetical protein
MNLKPYLKVVEAAGKALSSQKNVNSDADVNTATKHLDNAVNHLNTELATATVVDISELKDVKEQLTKIAADAMASLIKSKNVQLATKVTPSFSKLSQFSKSIDSKIAELNNEIHNKEENRSNSFGDVKVARTVQHKGYAQQHDVSGATQQLLDKENQVNRQTIKVGSGF